MASKKAVVMKVAVLAFVLALSSTVISARPDAHVLDLFDLLSAAESHVSNNFVTYPPICRCYDTTESCSPVCSADAAANSVLKRSIVAPN
ncbi:hypothetical protein FEM48_Zijuj05G0084600 [Ziziphus jujuba var. spinosa]|uniref:Uncharacterized protein n=1 Tax=Ziziphus jujuba var. spinosa TaxID=714518 RepID=A0A978VDW7_ZIZJJ|nr:hypothetical protein FEM48_Zijuj05G0084600 [Ziziphus jujuba var. spinosa]